MKSADSDNNMKVYSRTSTAMAKDKSLGGSKGIVGLQISYHANVVCSKKEKDRFGQLQRQTFGFGSQEKNKHVHFLYKQSMFVVKLLQNNKFPV